LVASPPGLPPVNPDLSGLAVLPPYPGYLYQARPSGPLFGPQVAGTPGQVNPVHLSAQSSPTFIQVTSSGVALPTTTTSTSVANSLREGDIALESYRTAGYTLPENLANMEDDREDPAYELGLNPQASNILDLSVPLDSLRNDVRSRHPDMPQPRVIPPTQPTSLGLGQYGSSDGTTNNNLPLSPALLNWMEIHTSTLQGKGRLGRSQRSTPFPKGQYPRLPNLAPGRYLPPDASSLFQAPTTPESWYKVCGGQSSFIPGAFTFSHREMDEQIGTAGKDISLVSDLDWMAEGASQLLNTMIATPESMTSDHLVFLQRYLLEMCRSLQFLGLSSTARHANLIWHMRDSYLSKVHHLVPKATKDALRGSPLNSEHLFKEETVAIAADNLRSDLQLQTNQTG